MNNNVKIAVTPPSFSANDILRKNLLEYFTKVKWNDTGKPVSPDELPSFLDGAEGAVTGLDIIDGKLLDKLPKLKIIAKYGVGLDMIDMPALESRGVKLGWTDGVNKRSVSELTLCFMLGLARQVFTSGYKCKYEGEWYKKGGFQITGKTIGIIGFGNIGQDTALLLKPFECRILVNDILDVTEQCKKVNASQAELKELLEQSDIVTLHVPLNDSTHYMINKDKINMMKKNAYLINTARGKVVNQTDLKHALSSERIAGAALDVFEEEPPTDTELLSLPNLAISAHIGGSAIEAVHAMGNSAIKHLKEFFNR